MTPAQGRVDRAGLAREAARREKNEWKRRATIAELQLQAVLKLHVQGVWRVDSEFADEFCAHCDKPWPCPTFVVARPIPPGDRLRLGDLSRGVSL